MTVAATGNRKTHKRSVLPCVRMQAVPIRRAAGAVFVCAAAIVVAMDSRARAVSLKVAGRCRQRDDGLAWMLGPWRVAGAAAHRGLTATSSNDTPGAFTRSRHSLTEACRGSQHASFVLATVPPRKNNTPELRRPTEAAATGPDPLHDDTLHDNTPTSQP
jgi:hypothetical protein